MLSFLKRMFTCSKCQRMKETKTITRTKNKRKNKTLKRKVKGG